MVKVSQMPYGSFCFIKNLSQRSYVFISINLVNSFEWTTIPTECLKNSETGGSMAILTCY